MKQTIESVVAGIFAAVVIYLILVNAAGAAQILNASQSAATNMIKALQGR